MSNDIRRGIELRFIAEDGSTMPMEDYQSIARYSFRSTENVMPVNRQARDLLPPGRRRSVVVAVVLSSIVHVESCLVPGSCPSQQAMTRPRVNFRGWSELRLSNILDFGAVTNLETQIVALSYQIFQNELLQESVQRGIC